MRVSHCLSSLATLSVAVSQHVPEIRTSSGLLRGIAPLPNVHAYLGIPYAEPPVGDLRFAPPQPIEGGNVDTVVDCYRVSPACFQHIFETPFSDRSTGVAESEDMMTINIWKPARASKEKLPVMVYLYGGGFTSGANASPEHNAAELVAEQNDIIVATINYRVNIFGFPNSEAIKTKNLGLLDQRLGIEWLRDNIEGFGGDSQRMTLAGHSAGSISIAYYSYTYVEDPIVSALIEFSGQPVTVPMDDGSSWKAVANATGCSNADSEAELACMRQVPARGLKKAMNVNNLATFTDPGIGGGSLVFDNETVLDPAEYAKRSAAGNFAKLPLLISNTFAEGDGVVPFTPVSGVNTTMSDMLTLSLFHCPVANAASTWASHNITTWRYLYNGTFAATFPYPWLRSYHGSDLSLVFAQEDRIQYEDKSPALRKAARYIRDAVSSFVRDPEHGLAGEGLGWEKYDPERSTLMKVFGDESAAVTVEDPSIYDQPCEALAP